MRIVVDVDSVGNAARVVSAAADEFELAARKLQRGDGLWGVTGPERYWLLTSLESVAARLITIAAAHRTIASELSWRAAEAGSNRVSPIYAGTSAISSTIGAGLWLDRDGDGVSDTIALDQDGDGRYETFVTDQNLDGTLDTVLVSDAAGQLVAAGWDDNLDGRIDGLVAIGTGGPVWVRADGQGGYTVERSEPHTTNVQPGALLGSYATIGGAMPGYQIVAPDQTIEDSTSGILPGVSTIGGVPSPPQIVSITDPSSGATTVLTLDELRAISRQGGTLAPPSIDGGSPSTSLRPRWPSPEVAIVANPGVIRDFYDLQSYNHRMMNNRFFDTPFAPFSADGSPR